MTIMRQNVYGLKDVTNETVVEVVRRRFLCAADANPHLYHEIDVERVRCEDWQVERFVLDKGSADSAYEALTKALEWKHRFGVHDRSHQYFPKELYQIFGYERPSRDRKGRLVLWGVQRNFRKYPKFNLLIKQFTAFIIERVDREAGNRGWINASDSSGTGVTSADMELIKFAVQLLDYYPKGMQMGLNVDMPWIMSGIWKIVKTFYNKDFADKVILISRDQLSDYCDVEDIPVWLGGKREPIYEFIPDMSPLYKLKHLGFSDNKIKTFYDIYKIEMDE